MKYKIIKIIGIFSFIILILYLILNRYRYQDYTFVYPRSWFVSDMQGNYFNGLVLSDRKIGDSQADFDGGAFIEISFIEDVGDNQSVESYIKELKDDEVVKIKAGSLPTVPGPSQYEYVGSDGLGLNGFDRVTSLSALPDDMDTRLYWKISNKKLYQVFIKYPQYESQTFKFNLIVQLFFLTFNTK